MRSPSWTVHEGDALAVLRTLPSESVQCCVTSPPYWGLRDYGVAGQIGREETPEAWVERLVEVFAEVRRVLRADGTLWLNVGDCYASASPRVCARPAGCKPKDLVGQPWMLAFALRADGWYLRAEIIWHKRSVMPESVADRPTRAHEQLFLFARSERYYYDAEAIREPSLPSSDARYAYAFGGSKSEALVNADASGPGNRTRPIGYREPSGLRNKRSVWTLGPEPCVEAHFATFPTTLVVPCLLAGASARGACAACGAPQRRIVEATGGCLGAAWHDHAADAAEGAGQGLADGSQPRTELYGTYRRRATKGWEPSCACPPAPLVPCVALDPFVGSGTTGIVARRLGLSFVGIELKPEYAAMARRRIEGALHSEARPAASVEPGQLEMFA